MFRWDAQAALAKVGVPVLILAGRQDIVTRADASEHIRAHTPEAELRVIDDANHMGFLERAEAYNNALAKFAAQVLAARPAS